MPRKRKAAKAAAAEETPPTPTESDSNVENICTICLVAMKNPFELPCGHSFCAECLQTTVQFGRMSVGTPSKNGSSHCPLCRAVFRTAHLLRIGKVLQINPFEPKPKRPRQATPRDD